MFVLSSPVTLQLARGELIAWPRRSAVTVKVIAGTVWITRCNDLDDHLLHAGMSMPLARGSRAVIEGECAAVVRFESALGWPGRLRRTLAWQWRRLVRALRLPATTVPG